MELKLEAEIKRSKEICYNAFTDEKQLSQWFSTNSKCDVRTGGYYCNDDKDEGVYLELKPYERIRFTWDNKEHCPGTEVLIEFNSSDSDNTKIILTHLKLENEFHIKEMTTGWTWALVSLKSYLENGKPVTYNEWLNSENK